MVLVEPTPSVDSMAQLRPTGDCSVDSDYQQPPAQGLMHQATSVMEGGSLEPNAGALGWDVGFRDES